MSRKGFKIILQQVLHRSPQRQFNRFQKICYATSSSPQMMSEKAYLDKNLADIYCDFLLSNQHRTIQNKPSILLDYSMKLQSSLCYALNKQSICNKDIEEGLISISKKLQDFKNSHQVYNQAQELVISMSSEQANENKKYLMFIYRWCLNQKGRINLEFVKLVQQLKVIVVQKLSQAYANSQQSQEIENQLKKLQILAKARQFKLKGDYEQAKLNYELVYKNLKNSQQIRIQALQYLCKNSQKNRDQNYLKNIMIDMIEQRGEYKHIKYVQKSLSLINQNLQIQSRTNSQIYQE